MNIYLINFIFVLNFTYMIEFVYLKGEKERKEKDLFPNEKNPLFHSEM